MVVQGELTVLGGGGRKRGQKRSSQMALGWRDCSRRRSQKTVSKGEGERRTLCPLRLYKWEEDFCGLSSSLLFQAGVPSDSVFHEMTFSFLAWTLKSDSMQVHIPRGWIDWACGLQLIESSFAALRFVYWAGACSEGARCRVGKHLLLLDGWLL